LQGTGWPCHLSAAYRWRGGRSRGPVHGIDRLRVADASIMSEIPGANTNLPTLMLAERLAALM